MIPTLSKNTDPEPLRDKPPPGLTPAPVAPPPPPPPPEEKGAAGANDEVWEDDIGPTVWVCFGLGAGSQSMSLVWVRVLLLSTLTEPRSDVVEVTGGALGTGIPEPPPRHE